MKTKVYFLILCTSLVFSSCEKENYSSFQSVRVFNNTSFNLDTIKLLSIDEFRLSGHFDTLLFNDVEIDSITNYQGLDNMSLELWFELNHKDTILTRSFIMPSYVIDPAGISRYTTCPNGSYTFGIFNSDTTIESLFIGLEGYGN
jgi:hypothetical protein